MGAAAVAVAIARVAVAVAIARVAVAVAVIAIVPIALIAVAGAVAGAVGPRLRYLARGTVVPAPGVVCVSGEHASREAARRDGAHLEVEEVSRGGRSRAEGA